MKKVLLSFFVVFAFVFYSFYQRQKDVEPQVLPFKISSQPQTKPIFDTAYKDGEYTGQVADAFYGNVQVKAVVAEGKLSEVQIIEYPVDRSTSMMINDHALPLLFEEALTVQDSDVDTITGATFTSEAFRKSLEYALDQAVR